MPGHFIGNYFDSTFINKVKFTDEYVILLLFLHVDRLICLMLSLHQGKSFPSVMFSLLFNIYIYIISYNIYILF